MQQDMKRYILILAAAFAAFSCNLDRYPYSEVAENEYVKDAKSVNNLVIGAYNGLYDVLYVEWAMTELRTDNARMRVNASSSNETKLIEGIEIVDRIASVRTDYNDRPLVPQQIDFMTVQL